MTALRGKISVITAYFVLLGAWILGFGACTTTEMKPAPAPTISPPDYVKVPQPAGFDMADLSTIFLDPKALSPEAVKTCDAEYLKLRKITLSEDEIRQGVRELVKRDPVHYHWCFYGKILELEGALRELSYIDEKQKKVLDTYMFLVPIARSFLKEYHDSRYLRWAVRRYRHVSEWVFYRRLEQTPQMTQELVEAANPFGLWREPVVQGSVLEKYHLSQPAKASPAPEAQPPSETAQAEPAKPAEPVPTAAPAAQAPAAQSPAAQPPREPASAAASSSESLVPPEPDPQDLVP